jgi:hypothetical protein
VSDEDRNEGPLSGTPLLRYYTRELRRLGFRYGTPIYRATADFTVDDLKTALFEAGTVAFQPVGSFEIRTHVTGIRNYNLTQNTGFGDLFADFDHARTGRCWMVEGFLAVPHPDPEIEFDFAQGDTAEPEYVAHDPQEDDELYVHVLAIVAVAEDGHVISAVVQRLPCVGDQLLHIPPSWRPAPVQGRAVLVVGRFPGICQESSIFALRECRCFQQSAENTHWYALYPSG